MTDTPDTSSEREAIRHLANPQPEVEGQHLQHGATEDAEVEQPEVEGQGIRHI